MCNWDGVCWIVGRRRIPTCHPPQTLTSKSTRTRLRHTSNPSIIAPVSQVLAFSALTSGDSTTNSSWATRTGKAPRTQLTGHYCQEHQMEFKQYHRGNGVWYSHNAPDREWSGRCSLRQAVSVSRPLGFAPGAFAVADVPDIVYLCCMTLIWNETVSVRIRVCPVGRDQYLL